MSSAVRGAGAQALVSESHLRSLKHMSLAEEMLRSRIKGCPEFLQGGKVHECFSGHMWTVGK